MKRFVDTCRMDEGWYVDLPAEMKAAYELIWSKCDCAGVWEPSYKLADYIVGKKVNWKELQQKLAGRIVILPSGGWWIIDFVKIQCGQLSAECRAHSPVINKLKFYGLLNLDSLSIVYPIDYWMTTGSHLEQEQEKKQEKIEGVKGENKARGSKEEIEVFARSLLLPTSDGESCFFKWEANGWINGKNPILDWKNTMRSWKSAGYLPSQKVNGKPRQTEADRDFAKTGLVGTIELKNL